MNNQAETGDIEAAVHYLIGVLSSCNGGYLIRDEEKIYVSDILYRWDKLRGNDWFSENHELLLLSEEQINTLSTKIADKISSKAVGITDSVKATDTKGINSITLNLKVNQDYVEGISDTLEILTEVLGGKEDAR